MNSIMLLNSINVFVEVVNVQTRNHSASSMSVRHNLVHSWNTLCRLTYSAFLPVNLV